jgi:outer membrane protein OmpU
MKRILLGSSALCALAMAGPAFAQTANEPVKLGLGGYWNSGYGDIVSQQGASLRGPKRRDDIDTDAILNVKGSTKLDNGLTVGASMQIRVTDQIPTANVAADLTTPTGDFIKRSYAYIRSDYGEIRIGDDDDARRQKSMTAPIAGGGVLFGANTPDMLFSNGPSLTNTTMRKLENEKRISRLAYFTPTIAGFSGAFSYAPGGEKAGIGNNAAPNTTVTNGVSAVNQAISAAVSYSGKFGDFGLDAYTGFSNGHRMRTTVLPDTRISGRNNPFAVAGGAVVGWGPFKFGGAYEYLYDRDVPFASGSGHQARNTWDIGPEYIMGPFSVSVDWTRAILQNRNFNSSAHNDIISLATDYQLGPGIDVGFAIDFTHYSSTTQVGVGNIDPNYNGLALIAALGIGF